MPDNPYIISGTIKGSNEIGSDSAEIIFTVNGVSSSKQFSNNKGQYVFDLAELSYSSGDNVTYSANDKFNNEIYNGSFTVSGQNKSLDISLSARDFCLVPPGNRNFQIHTVGGEAVTNDNPFPVMIANDSVPNQNPAITLGYDGSNNVTSVTETIEGITYVTTLTWSGSNLTNVSKKTKQ